MVVRRIGSVRALVTAGDVSQGIGGGTRGFAEDSAVRQVSSPRSADSGIDRRPSGPDATHASLLFSRRTKGQSGRLWHLIAWSSRIRDDVMASDYVQYTQHLKSNQRMASFHIVRSGVVTALGSFVSIAQNLNSMKASKTRMSVFAQL